MNIFTNNLAITYAGDINNKAIVMFLGIMREPLFAFVF